MNRFGKEEFISEPLKPFRATGDVRAMARGEPGLPCGFTWREDDYRILKMLGKWKTSGKGKGGGVYLRRHWYRVVTDPPLEMTLYCLRQAPDPKHPKSRWYLYTVRRKVED